MKLERQDGERVRYFFSISHKYAVCLFYILKFQMIIEWYVKYPNYKSFLSGILDIDSEVDRKSANFRLDSAFFDKFISRLVCWDCKGL